MDRSRQWRSSIVVAAISDRSGTRDVLKKPFNLSGFQIFLFKFCQFIIFVTYVHSDDVVSFVASISSATMCDQGSQSLVAITDRSLSRVSGQASLSHAMKDNYVRDQLSSISASVLSWLINRPDHLAMPTLSQLPFQAEGYRHLVCLIANYGSGRIGPTIGSRRRNGVLYCDIVIALSQTCPAIHAWFNI